MTNNLLKITVGRWKAAHLPVVLEGAPEQTARRPAVDSRGDENE